MEKFANFFRVFDVAFFVPGFAVVGLVFFIGLPTKLDSLTPNALKVGAIAAIAIVGSYIVGLILHGIARLLRCIGWLREGYGRLRKNVKKTSSSSNAFLQKEMQLYFWNLGSMCWSLCIAIPIDAMIIFVSMVVLMISGIKEWCEQWWVVAIAIIIIAIAINIIAFFSVLLCWLGGEFRQSSRRVQESHTPKSG